MGGYQTLPEANPDWYLLQNTFLLSRECFRKNEDRDESEEIAKALIGLKEVRHGIISWSACSEEFRTIKTTGALGET